MTKKGRENRSGTPNRRSKAQEQGSQSELQALARAREMAASAGLAQSRISLEVLYLLPRDFMAAYVELFDKALKEDTVGTHYPDPDTQPKRIDPKHRGKKISKGTTTKRFKLHWIIRDEKALELKKRVDRKLSKLVKEMRAGKIEEHHSSRCVQCQRFIEQRWPHCPWCGRHQS